VDAQLTSLAVAEKPDVALVVDLDGTLIATDLLLESFLGVASRSPLAALAALPSLAGGRAALKRRLAERFVFDPAHLPYNPEVLRLIDEAREEGRTVCIASASDAALVKPIAEHLGLKWFASDGETNLKGERKGELLAETFGEGEFDYVGNEACDLAVWRRARTAIVVGKGKGPTHGDMGPAQRIAGRTPVRRAWLKMLRPHQWAKNVLVLVPVATSHHFGLNVLLDSVLAFAAFSLCASGVYVINDLVDIQADRAHPTKRLRPFASGDVPILKGALIAAVALLSAAALAWSVNPQFSGFLLLYFAANLLYSFSLKRKMIIDVVTLGSLYTVRVLAGAAAIGVVVSEWLMAFSMFMFMFLAIIKRHSEMVMRINAGLSDPTNRNYKAVDINVLTALAAAAGYSSVIVFALYIASDGARSLYSHVQYLWFVCPLLLYWVARTIMMSQRQHIPDDPVMFALRDRVTWGIAALVLALGAVSL